MHFHSRAVFQAKKALVAALKVVTTDDVEVRIAIAENDVEREPASPYHVTVFFVVDQIEWVRRPDTWTEAYAAFPRHLCRYWRIVVVWRST